MFLIGFVVALVLCLPLCIGNATFAEWTGWNQVSLWPWLSGAMTFLMAGIAALKRRQRDAEEGWLGAMFGVIVGCGALWGLQLFG